MLFSQIQILVRARCDRRTVLQGTTAATFLTRISNIWILETLGEGSSHLFVQIIDNF
jgi:hypothetical protein